MCLVADYRVELLQSVAIRNVAGGPTKAANRAVDIALRSGAGACTVLSVVKVAGKGDKRCEATEVTIDGPVPVDERCVLVAGHDGGHHSKSGRQFESDERTIPASTKELT
jgi:hypothetical protein